MFRKIVLTFIALSVWISSWSQPLFSIAGKDVTANEFRRECKDVVDGADTSGLYSLMMDYADYRLVVHDARVRSCDTTATYRSAMRHYSDMLMYRYVANNPHSQAQINKLFQHSGYQYKLWVARIDIYANSGRDTSSAYSKAMRLIDRIGQGRRFEDVAIQFSDAPESKYDGGYLGYVSPIDFHVGEEVEDYIFEHWNDGEEKVSRPIRSGNSYYIVKVGGRRRAVSSVNVSPIIVRKQARRHVNDSLRTLFGSIYSDLSSGAKSFEALQSQYSDIKFAEQLPLAEAYRKYTTHLADIEGVGKYSRVIETPNFFCILKLNSQTPLEIDDNYRKWLDTRIYSSNLFAESYDGFLDSLRTAMGYRKTSGLDKICRLMPDSAIFEGKWDPGLLRGLDGELFTFDGKSYSLKDFAEYIESTQYSTGYMKITDYVAQRYDDYLNLLTQDAASKVIGNSDYYKQEMAYYSNAVCYDIVNPDRKFTANALDTAKVYRFYKDSKMSCKTSHVLNIRFFDYFSESNRKKAMKVSSVLATNPQYAYDHNVMKAGDSGIFRKGDNSLADKIIGGYDSGRYNATDNKVIFFAENHTVAIVDVEQKPVDLPEDELFQTVSPLYLKQQKEDYLRQLRSKYNLVVLPGASQVLETIVF